MPAALAGVASVFWGASDFLGGLATTGWRAERVGALAQGVGFVALLVVAPFVTGAIAPSTDLAWGAAAGVSGAFGIALLYRSLAIGPMNAAAPTVAVVSALVPAVVGLVTGERPSAIALVGVVVAIVAVALVGGASRPGVGEPKATGRVLVLAALSGAGLGLANVCFAATDRASGLWPVVAEKGVSAVVLGALVLAWRASDRPRATARTVRLAVATGASDAVATASVAVALQRGPLVLVAVLASLFPAVTVILARFVLTERIGRAQAVGLALALAAIAMIIGG
jgi:drug/metabolite transporter (DMT)-like permease